MRILVHGLRLLEEHELMRFHLHCAAQLVTVALYASCCNQ